MYYYRYYRYTLYKQNTFTFDLSSTHHVFHSEFKVQRVSNIHRYLGRIIDGPQDLWPKQLLASMQLGDYEWTLRGL